MKQALSYIISQLVDHPEEVTIDEHKTADKTTFTIHVHVDDVGKVIGKKGRIISAIRDLIKLMAVKRGVYVDVMLAEAT